MIKKSEVLIREAVLADVYRLAPRLREQDLQEVWASHHLTGEAALLLSFFESERSFAAVCDGQVAAMWGTARLKGKPGALAWFLGSEVVAEYPVTLFRGSRQFVRQALQYYGYLENWVDVRNTLSVDWLRWLGFTFAEPAPYGRDGGLFYHFYAKIPTVGNLNKEENQDVCCSSGRDGQCVNGSGNGCKYVCGQSAGKGYSGGL